MASWLAVVVLIALTGVVLAGNARLDRRLRAMRAVAPATRDDLKALREELRDRIDRHMKAAELGAPAVKQGASGRAPTAVAVKSWDSRLDRADPRAVVTFGICLTAACSVRDWHHTERLLDATLHSVLRQSDPRLRVAICGHDVPAIAGLDDERVAFLRLDHPAPTDASGFQADKTRKRFNLGRRLREVGGGYYMQLDADDLVARDLVETVLASAHPSGFLLADGYALDWAASRVAPAGSVWPFGLDRVCGSTSVVFLTEEDLPGPDDTPTRADLLFNMMRQHANVETACWEMGRSLKRFDGRPVIYVVNHDQNLSFQLQKAGIRGRTIVSRIAANAVTEPDDLARIDRRFGTRLLQARSDAAAEGLADRIGASSHRAAAVADRNGATAPGERRAQRARRARIA